MHLHGDDFVPRVDPLPNATYPLTDARTAIDRVRKQTDPGGPTWCGMSLEGVLFQLKNLRRYIDAHIVDVEEEIAHVTRETK